VDTESVYLLLDVRLSAYISVIITGRAYMKFGIGDFYKILSRKSKYG
jgi:hypothetical protein